MYGLVSGHSSEMWTLYLTVFIISPVVTTANEIFLNNNDWIPVSSDTIYNQIRHEIIPIPHYVATHNIQVINTDMNKIVSPPNKVKIQEDITDDTATNIEMFELDCFPTDDNNCQNEEIKNINPNIEFDFVPNVIYQTLKENDTVRRSKKLSEFNFKNDVQLHASKDKVPNESKDKTYEVTEESDLESLFEPEKSETMDTGYKYEPPKKQNITKGLFEILSKYNINKDDELTNYAVSRRQKMQIPVKQNVLLEPFNNVHHKYNNLNHLSVDPLLAVFLSNYGFYLQGMYGIRNRYNNLYGYLASNNIHNNRPFGFYKVFSDTDSSH